MSLRPIAFARSFRLTGTIALLAAASVLSPDAFNSLLEEFLAGLSE